MANTVVDSLTIEIKVNDKDAVAKLDAIKEKLEGINEAAVGAGFNELKDLSGTIGSIAGSLKKLEKTAEAFRNISNSSKTLADGLKSIGSNRQNLSNLSKSLNSAKKAMDSANQNQAKGFLSAFGDKVWSGFGAVASNMPPIMNGFKGMAYYGAQLSKIPFNMIFDPLKRVASTVDGIGKSFSHLFHTIGRIAFTRAIRGAIRMLTQALKEGVNDLYLWASAVGNSFKPTMDSLASSFLYLKNSVGAAVSPILDALAPAVEVAINKLVELINVFNQVIATLTGASTWRKAIRSAADYTDNISGLGHDAQDANDSVKELKRTLLGFDEINRLDDKTKTVSKGSNGKDATGYYAKEGAMSFAEMPISSSVENFADKLRDAWRKANFTEIGSIIGTKVGDALLKVPWETKIQPTVSKIAKSFGTLLNGMFDYNGSKGGKKMWEGIAYTIYNGINTAVLGRVTFFKTVNWSGIGAGVGYAVKTSLYNINWTGPNGISEALAAFPNAVIDAISGFCQKMSPADFHQTGIRIGETVSDAIINIKWKEYFNNAFGMADRLLQAINGALEGFGKNWEGIKNGIINGIKSVPAQSWNKLGTDIGNFIWNSGSFVVNLIDCLKKALQAGEWGNLISGIWDAICKHVSNEYGGWSGAAIALAGWVGNNLDILMIPIAFAIGSATLKTGVTALKTAFMGALVPGTGLGFSTWAKNISLVAGIVLAISTIKSVLGKDYSNQTFKKSLESRIIDAGKGALAGAFIGFKFGGAGGALAGLVLGFSLTMSFSAIKSNFEKVGWQGTASALAIGIGAGLAAFAVTGNPAAGFFAASLAIELTLAIEKIWPEFKKGVKEDALKKISDWAGSPDVDVAATVNPLGGYDAGLNGSKVNSKTKSNKEYGGKTSSGNGIMQKSNLKLQATAEINSVSDKLTTKQKTLADFIANVFGLKDSIKPSLKITNGFTALYEWMKGNGVIGKIIPDFIADYTKGMKGKGVIGTIIDMFTANYTKGMTGKGVIGTIIDKFKANYSDGMTGSGVKGKTIPNFTAKFNDWISGWRDWSVSGFTAGLTSYVTLWKAALWTISGFIAGLTGTKKADGGVYSNGLWHDITKYASGGAPGSGQMFIARESGPELVGTLAGSTAVMNNDQIVSSVSDGVARAVAAVLAGQNNDAPFDITIKIDSETIYRAVKKGERKASGRYGTSVAVG